MELMGFTGTGIRTVLMARADLPITRIVMKGVTVFVHHVGVVSYVGLAVLYGVLPSEISVLTFLYLFRRFLITGLSGSMAFDLSSTLPPLEVRQYGAPRRWGRPSWGNG